jgi:hypothetical protein
MRTIAVTPMPVDVPSGVAVTEAAQGKPAETMASETNTPSGSVDTASEGRELSGAEVAAAQGVRICRDSSTDVTVEGEGTVRLAQRLCRNEQGDYVPVSTVAERQ